MTSFGTVSYTYNQENQMIRYVGAATDQYLYDGDGKRVKKNASSVTLYWYDIAGNVLEETTGAGALLSDYIYFNGKRVARRDADGSIHYYFSDHLGSASVIAGVVNNVAVIQNESDYYPYGGEIPITSGDSNHYKFTGKERDADTCTPTTTCLDNFGARYYGSAIGRFMTPDWDARPATVPYAVFGDPQTLNLYTYVENAPINRADADGHEGPDQAHPGCTGGDSANCNMEANEKNAKQPPPAPAQNQNAPHPYVAPIGPGTEIGNILDPAHPSNPGPIGKGECVEACRHYEKGLPDHTQWTKGVPVVITVDGKLTINPAVKPGTAIAAGWDAKGHYPGPENSHKNSGVFLGPALIGSAGSIRILDQWPGSPGPRPRDMNPTGGYGTWDVSNHSTAYYVIMAP